MAIDYVGTENRDMSVVLETDVESTGELLRCTIPIYEYLCPEGHYTLRVLPVAEHQVFTCCDCERNWARQVIGAPLALKIQPECRYDSPIDGTPITTWAQRANDLAKNNCEEYDPERKKDNERAILEKEKSLDHAISESVGMAVARMDTKTRGKLYSELTEQNKSVEVIRT